MCDTYPVYTSSENSVVLTFSLQYNTHLCDQQLAVQLHLDVILANYVTFINEAYGIVFIS